MCREKLPNTTFSKLTFINHFLQILSLKKVEKHCSRVLEGKENVLKPSLNETFKPRLNQA